MCIKKLVLPTRLNTLSFLHSLGSPGNYLPQFLRLKQPQYLPATLHRPYLKINKAHPTREKKSKKRTFFLFPFFLSPFFSLSFHLAHYFHISIMGRRKDPREAEVEELKRRHAERPSPMAERFAAYRARIKSMFKLLEGGGHVILRPEGPIANPSQLQELLGLAKPPEVIESHRAHPDELDGDPDDPLGDSVQLYGVSAKDFSYLKKYTRNQHETVWFKRGLPGTRYTEPYSYTRFHARLHVSIYWRPRHSQPRRPDREPEPAPGTPQPCQATPAFRVAPNIVEGMVWQRCKRPPGQARTTLPRQFSTLLLAEEGDTKHRGRSRVQQTHVPGVKHTPRPRRNLPQMHYDVLSRRPQPRRSDRECRAAPGISRPCRAAQGHRVAPDIIRSSSEEGRQPGRPNGRTRATLSHQSQQILPTSRQDGRRRRVCLVRRNLHLCVEGNWLPQAGNGSMTATKRGLSRPPEYSEGIMTGGSRFEI